MASVSGEGADGPKADEVGLEELHCLVLTTFPPGAEGGEELDVGVVAGCDCVQVKGGKVYDNGVLVEEAERELFDGGVTLVFIWYKLVKTRIFSNKTALKSLAERHQS